jgi:hypothetical protein
MRLKLRQSSIFAYGHLHIALEEARRIRGLLINIPLEKYTDIDVSLCSTKKFGAFQQN